MEVILLLIQIEVKIVSGCCDNFDSSDIDFLITLLKRQFNYREDVDCEKIDSQQTGNNESLRSLEVFIVKTSSQKLGRHALHQVRSV